MNQCLDLLKREEVKREFKQIIIPYMNILLSILQPYIIIIITLLFMNTSLLCYLCMKYFLKT